MVSHATGPIQSELGSDTVLFDSKSWAHYLTVSRMRHEDTVMNEDKTVFEYSPLGQQVDTSPSGIRHEELP